MTILRRAAPLGLALLAGCWVPLEKGRQMEARLQQLEVQNAEQRRRLDEQRELVRERVAKVDQKIVEVQAKIDELNRAARRSGADLGVSLQRLQDDFAKFKGDVEVEQHRLGQIEKNVDTLRTETEGRFAALRGAGALEAFEAKQRLATLQRPDDKAAFFSLAKSEDEAGNKGVARELYEEYVRRWPADPRASDAGYRAGELLFDQKRFREALLAYGKVAEEFPKSARAPDAMLGAADAMVKLEMKTEAKAVLEQLLERYPRSDAAKTAKERLAALTPPSAKKKPPAPRRSR
ncbi:tetratricopeptide repeat protein [Anaeromyxobacter sp. Fw109-5]|uniref:tetratricopeptide repeat protein n=1 Tax=Anaeromyxobacter sp. (strain Fw109-5) TaxID=404589 RepID=UPI000158A54A|nr:tetratricopeptide repeat protein [Anaeromyxobacter sp. Fw109-5]ABS27586.1 Tol-Pal system YbgF [Anaeromyxobacter sp. Fw109-5]